MAASSKHRAPNAPPPISPVEHVRRLAEAGLVDEARRFAEARSAEGDTAMGGWAQLLKAPRVKTSPRRSRGDFGVDYAWLRDNREAFLGRWVALREGVLLDSDMTLRALLGRLTESGQMDGAFVVRVD